MDMDVHIKGCTLGLRCFQSGTGRSGIIAAGQRLNRAFSATAFEGICRSLSLLASSSHYSG